MWTSLELEDGSHVSPPPIAAEVGLDDLGVAADLGGRSLCDDLAVVQHRDALADAHHDPHVVLDEEDGQAELVAQAADEVDPSVAGLAAVHAGGRLVEEQQLRLRGQRAGDLQPALVAVRQVARPGIRAIAQADESQQLAAAGRAAALPGGASECAGPRPTSGS